MIAVAAACGGGDRLTVQECSDALNKKIAADVSGTELSQKKRQELLETLEACDEAGIHYNPFDPLYTPQRGD
ncbi:MAG: hypothetical protein Q8Q00_06345 [Dehalococcoidia bacterium]|nr:hypothetical protein [Dehalococcoidia bacterium]